MLNIEDAGGLISVMAGSGCSQLRGQELDKSVWG